MPAPSDPSAGDMTIDELARAAGVVVSTVRLYQNRGLLAPPARRGRVGYYGEGHLGRLRLISGLQARGFSLAAIKQLLDGLDRGDSLTAVLGLAGDGGDAGAGPAAPPTTWTAERPEEMSLADLSAALPRLELTPEVIARVVALGLVELPASPPSGDDGGRVVVTSPSFLRAGAALAALGVPADVILDQYEALRRDAGHIAERFTDVFRTHLWGPFAEAGMPARRAAELVATLEALGLLAEGVVVTTLRQALQARAEEFARSEAERLGVAVPRPGGPPA